MQKEYWKAPEYSEDDDDDTDGSQPLPSGGLGLSSNTKGMDSLIDDESDNSQAFEGRDVEMTDVREGFNFASASIGQILVQTLNAELMWDGDRFGYDGDFKQIIAQSVRNWSLVKNVKETAAVKDETIWILPVTLQIKNKITEEMVEIPNFVSIFNPTIPAEDEENNKVFLGRLVLYLRDCYDELMESLESIKHVMSTKMDDGFLSKEMKEKLRKDMHLDKLRTLKWLMTTLSDVCYQYEMTFEKSSALGYVFASFDKEGLSWYTEKNWKMDRSHRKLFDEEIFGHFFVDFFGDHHDPETV